MPIYSMPFNPYRWSQFDGLHRCVGQLSEEIDTRKPCKHSRTASRQKQFRSVIRLLILNAYVVHMCGSDVTFGVDLAKSHFAKGSRYRKLFITYETFITAFNGLRALGYLEIVKTAWYDSATKTGQNTKVRGTDKLIDLLTETHCLKLRHVEISPEKPSLILKNSDKKEIPFKPTAITRKYEDNLTIINRRLSRSWIDLNILDSEWETLNDRIAKNKKPHDVKVLDLTRRRSYRVFNNSSFEAGGRFYGGWWQRLPKEYRKHVTIDGKATIEIDYSGLHPAILYAEADAEIPDDPYDIGLSPSAREAVKKAMFILLNAEGAVSHKTKREIEESAGIAWDEIQRLLIESERHEYPTFPCGPRGPKLPSRLPIRTVA